MFRYVSALVVPGSRTATSASRTCGESASGSEWTATVRRPISLAVRKTRRAISPRLATSRVENVGMLVTISHPDRSHPERGEGPGPPHRSGVDRRQREADHGPGLPGVDDAVV